MTAIEHLQIHAKNNMLQKWNQIKHLLYVHPHCPSQRHLNGLPLKTLWNSLPWSEDSFASISLPDFINAVFKLYVCQKCNLTVLPITTKFSSCFPPCLFFNSAFTSICGFALLDFFAGVGTIFCSSETCATWGEGVDFETASSTPEATLMSSSNSPFWGVLMWPFSSAIALGEKKKTQRMQMAKKT